MSCSRWRCCPARGSTGRRGWCHWGSEIGSGSCQPRSRATRPGCGTWKGFLNVFWIGFEGILKKYYRGFFKRVLKFLKVVYRVFHMPTDLVWVDFDLGVQLPSRFCWIPISPGRIGQTVEHTKFKSTLPNKRADGTPWADLGNRSWTRSAAP